MQRPHARKITKTVTHPNETNPDKPLIVTMHRLTGDERKTNSRKMRDLNRPYVTLDPRTDQPFLQAGEPIVTERIPASRVPEITRIALASYVDNVENLFDENGHPIGMPDALEELSKEYLNATFEEDFEVPAEGDQPARTERRTITIPFSDYLGRKQSDAKFWDADPLASSSEKPQTGSEEQKPSSAPAA